MSKTNVRRQALERSTSFKDTQKILNQSFFHNKNFKKVYPIGLQKSTSSLSLSSVSLSLSQNSNDSSQADSLTPLDEKISLALGLISASPHERRESVPKAIHQEQPSPLVNIEQGELKRCNWITQNSGNAISLYNLILPS
jgi:DNA-3-methyladenine glycosylase I